ncbi:phosphoglycerate kinase [Enterobacteriaceae endosymbiont of Neohaemonia nigricornis]|uniref:phosphoglycerate kinase n=1 Tax=Enterobacteriaceae endosymbiont of Neohaemonia nigricornis TaxID=2675792 RepID=UPI0014492121|nr:phosphoglycerate kinase [Enterobacteriaceae endosymbiont of Neohaemonia nigricornis]QJC30332.1 phosphoglycerate kinase [Enterobacteriaceae endosymbiont of Neohaemonia nigricornis]
MSIKNILDIEIQNKVVFIRSDFNVPIDSQGKIISDIRIKLSLPTIKYALYHGAKIIIASHLGRPVEGEYNNKLSLKNIAVHLSNLLNHPVILKKKYLDGISFKKNEIILLENIRFNIGEKANDITLSKKYAALCDVFVMDAFATAHRKHASTYGIISFVQQSCAGLLLINELINLKKFLYKPKKPIISIIGGAKISTKFSLLNKLSKMSDKVIVGGGIANTILATKYNIGSSLYEKNAMLLAKDVMTKCKNIILPVDFRVGINFSNTSPVYIRNTNNILYNEKIMDIGDQSIQIIINILNKASTILWNGPVGVFEFQKFCEGTKNIAKTIAKNHAFSIVGGGDTLAAIELFNVFNNISYISTGGGSFLKFIENNTLVVIEKLKQYI